MKKKQSFHHNYAEGGATDYAEGGATEVYCNPRGVRQDHVRAVIADSALLSSMEMYAFLVPTFSVTRIFNRSSLAVVRNLKLSVDC